MWDRLGPALALALLIAIGAFGLGREIGGYQAEPYEKSEPTKADNQNAPLGDPVAALRQEKQDGERAEKSYWQTVFLDHITDWILATFTGFLVLYTRRLYVETGGLKESTDKLWKAGVDQLAVARQSADAATKSADAVRDSTNAT